jgi:hypothetical protein
VAVDLRLELARRPMSTRDHIPIASTATSSVHDKAKLLMPA